MCITTEYLLWPSWIFEYLFTSALKCSHLSTKTMWYKKIEHRNTTTFNAGLKLPSKSNVSLPTCPQSPHPSNPGMVPNYLIQEQPNIAELYLGRAGLWYWLVQHTAVAGWLCCSNTFLSKKHPESLPPSPLHHSIPPPPPPPPSLCSLYSFSFLLFLKASCSFFFCNFPTLFPSQHIHCT